MTVPPDQSRAVHAVLNPDEQERIRKACTIVLLGDAARVDGDGWKVYLAGTVLRIDIDAGSARP